MTEPNGGGLQGQVEEDLVLQVAELESRAIPLQRQLSAIRVEVDAIRTELRRRQRLAHMQERRAVRSEMAKGHLLNFEEWVSGAAEAGPARAFADYRFLRESATEVRLGYASSSRQTVSFTDGRTADEATDLPTARGLFEQGWDFGTPQARGVRVYPTGTRAERVVPAAELHVELRATT